VMKVPMPLRLLLPRFQLSGVRMLQKLLTSTMATTMIRVLLILPKALKDRRFLTIMIRLLLILSKALKKPQLLKRDHQLLFLKLQFQNDVALAPLLLRQAFLHLYVLLEEQ